MRRWNHAVLAVFSLALVPGVLAYACPKIVGPINVPETSFSDIDIKVGAQAIEFTREERGSLLKYAARCIESKAGPDAKQSTTCKTWCIQPAVNWDSLRGDALGAKVPDVCHYNFKNEKAFDMVRDGKTVGRIKVDEHGALVFHSVEAKDGDFPVDNRKGIFRIEQTIEKREVAADKMDHSGSYYLRMEGFRYLAGNGFREGKKPASVQYDSLDPLGPTYRGSLKPGGPGEPTEMTKAKACGSGVCGTKCRDLDEYLEDRRQRLGVKDTLGNGPQDDRGPAPGAGGGVRAP